MFVLQKQWDTFEKVENRNSIVHSTLVGLKNTPGSANLLQSGDNVSDSLFYTFTGADELQEYRQGRLNHVQEYPTVTDFVVPYANKPIQVGDIIGNAEIFGEPRCCPNITKTIPLTNAERLKNRNALNLYIAVSTHTELYPKSPYKFKSNDDYLMYKNYILTNC